MFFTKNPNLKKTTFFGCGGQGLGKGARVREVFFKKTPNLKKKLFGGCGGGGGGGERG